MLIFASCHLAVFDGLEARGWWRKLAVLAVFPFVCPETTSAEAWIPKQLNSWRVLGGDLEIPT